MKIIICILLMPVRIVLAIAAFALEHFIKVECWVGGVVLLFLEICALLAWINGMWLQLGIFAMIIAAVLILLFLSAEVLSWMEIALDFLRG